MLLTTIFYHVDNFCKRVEKSLLTEKPKKRVGRPQTMRLSEILTIYIFFHHSKIKTFKDYYQIYIKGIHRNAFINIVSYNRFVELIQENMSYLGLFAVSLNANPTGVAFIDSTPIAVCHNKRIHGHKILKGIAQRGKCSMGWFFGFKLHFVINNRGEITGFTVTPGNVDDRDPKVISIVTKDLFGKLFGDRGYISKKLFEDLFERSIQLITKLRQNMKNKLMSIMDKLLLRRRGIVESSGNILKNLLNLEHTRHRSIRGFFCNIFSCIAAYAFYPTKPKLSCIFEKLTCES